MSSSSNNVKRHIPLIPEYKWAKYSEDIADRNRSSTDEQRPKTRDLQYTGLAFRDYAAQVGQLPAEPATEREGRSRHRPNRSIDVFEYARVRASQDEAERPKTSSEVKKDETPMPMPAQASTASSTDQTNDSVRKDSGSRKRSDSRGDRLRDLASSLARWPGEDKKPLFESSRPRGKSNSSANGGLIRPSTAKARPATSQANPQPRPDYNSFQGDLAWVAPRVRSQSVDAKRSMHYDRQRQQPTRPSLPIPPPSYAEPPKRAQHSQRPSSQAEVVVPDRSSSLGPLPSIQRKPVGHRPSPSLDANTAKAAAAAGLDISNSTETHVHTTMAPAVTQETVVPQVREIRKELITRDIHNTHIVHRVLPIKQTEHLPARHFVRSTSGGLKEVQEADVPRILGFA